MFIKDALHSNHRFSWQIALNCAEASQISYGNADQIKNETSTWGFERGEFFNEGGTQGFVAWDSKIVLVSFRGTKELGDWLINLNVMRKQNPPNYGKVHTGFYDGFDCVRAQVIELLNEANADGKTIWITGHSLGGAIATIMAAELLEEHKIDGIYPFAHPRVVNRRAQGLFRTHYQDRFFRFVNDDDVVPKLPALLKHVGTVLWFDKDGSMKKAPEGVRADDFGPEEMTEEEFEAEKKKFQSLQKQINEAHTKAAALSIEEITTQKDVNGEDVRGLLPSVRDHFMDNYIRKIQGKLNHSA